jgi:hypothetical protein
MNYFTDFLNREKIKSLDTESRLNLLNPDFDEKNLQTPDNESLLNRLNPEREYSEPLRRALFCFHRDCRALWCEQRHG